MSSEEGLARMHAELEEFRQAERESPAQWRRIQIKQLLGWIAYAERRLTEPNDGLTLEKLFEKEF